MREKRLRFYVACWCATLFLGACPIAAGSSFSGLRMLTSPSAWGLRISMNAQVSPQVADAVRPSGPVLPASFSGPAANSCTTSTVARVTGSVDDNVRASLQGNVHHLARAEFDQGRVDDNLPLEHMILMLQRSPEQEAALTTRIDQMHNRRSSYFHQWLRTEDFGRCYGVADSDIAVVTAWLQKHGFKIDTIPAGKTMIIFSGTAGQVRETFGTEIHNLNVRGESHIANMSEPQIPAALAPVISGFRSLHSFFPKPTVHVVGPIQRDTETGKWHVANLNNGAGQKASQPSGEGETPLLTFNGTNGTIWAVSPQDLYTIYNENPLLTASTPINGAGQTLAIVQQTDINPNDLTTFRSQFGLPAYPTTPNVTQGGVNFMDGVAGYCADPGNLTGLAESEADIDVQWMGTTAPAATIDFVSCASTSTTAGIDLSAAYIVNNLASTVSALSESFGACEADIGSDNAFYNILWEQAVAEGQTPIVSAGDTGDDVCDRGDGKGPNSGQDLGETGLSVNGLASTPYNLAAGGTDFSDIYQTNFTPTSYWNANDTSPYGSAQSYIPEMAWNGTCASPILVDYFRAYGTAILDGAEGLCNDASLSPPERFTTLNGGSGGISTLYGLPTWQSVYGVGLNDSTTQRNLPDVSLFASSGLWSHLLVFCQSDVAPCDFSTSFNGAGGTSFVAPMLGGIMGLINQAAPSGSPAQPTRQGQANYTLYALATVEYGTPTLENTSTAAPSAYTCESNYLAMANYSGIFPDCVFYDTDRTPQVGSNTCFGGAGPIGCLFPNNDQPCATGTTDCYTGFVGDAYGLLSTSTVAPILAFPQGAGYDDATGLGSVNIANLVNNWTTVTPKFPSTTTITVGTPSIFTTSTTSLSAVVSASGRGGIAPPLGDVTFYPGTACSGTALGTADLVPAIKCTTTCNSTASLSSVTGAQIGASNTSVIACFNGDGANDAPSTQSASVTVTQTALTVAPASSSVSITGGQTGTVTLAVSANAAVPTAVTFACSGLPSDASCTFSALASLSGTASANVTMTINTTTADAKLVPPARGSSWPMLGFALPGLLLVPAGARAMRRRKMWLLIGLVLLLTLSWAACGGGNSSTTTTTTSTSQNYSVTVTGSATGATAGTSSAITVTVTQ